MPGSLDEIRNWKLEAKFEDTERYFYEFAAVEQLINGSRYFVIGRKGTGKTAVSEHIRKLATRRAIRARSYEYAG